jgi:hypothetical protein
MNQAWQKQLRMAALDFSEPLMFFGVVAFQLVLPLEAALVDQLRQRGRVLVFAMERIRN